MRHPLIEHQKAIGLDPLLPVPFGGLAEDEIAAVRNLNGVKPQFNHSSGQKIPNYWGKVGGGGEI